MPDQPVSFPQDQATGLQDTIDWNDAGGFAWLVHHPNTTGHVISGFEFDPDWGNDILHITDGVANLEQESVQTNNHEEDGGDPAQTLEGATFRVQRGPSGDINLNPGVNHIWVRLDHAENNTVHFHVNATGNEPPAPYLKLGTVDTGENEITRANDFATHTIQKELLTERH